MNNTMWTILIVLAAAGMAVCLYRMHVSKRGIPGLRALDKDFQSLDMRFHYGAEQAYECFTRVGSEGRRLLMGFWRLDFAFILCFLVVMAAISRITATILPVRYAMYAAAALRAVLDMLENTLLMIACAAYDQGSRNGLLRAAGWITSLKWGALGLWVVGLFIGLFASAFGLV